MTEKIYENESDSTAYYGVNNVTINNYSTEQKHLSICQGCLTVRARAYEDGQDIDDDICDATSDYTSENPEEWVYGEHVWNHVNEIHIQFERDDVN